MSANPKATQGHAEDAREHAFRTSLTLVPGETTDGRVVLRCIELPISGSGNTREEALTDLFQQFYLYRISQAYDQPRSSFTSGLTSLWDFAGFRLRGGPVSPGVDAFAVATDWYAVGRDLSTAMQRFNGQITTRITEDVS